MTDAPVNDGQDAPAEPTMVGPPIKLRYESRMSEYLTSVAWAGRRSDLAFGIGVAGIVGGVVALALGDRLTFWFPLLLGLSFVTGVFGIPFFWFAIRRQRGLIGASIEDDIDSSGIHERTPLVDAKIAWDMYREVVDARDMIYLVSAMGVGFIPKRAFTPDQLEAFRGLVAAKALVRRPRILRRIAVTVVVFAVLVAIAIVPILLNQNLADSSARLALAPVVAGDTVNVSATTDLPDGTLIALEVYQVDEYRKSISAGSPVEAESNPWVEYQYVEVAGGTFEAAFGIGHWPAGRGRAVAFVSMHLQPRHVTDLFGSEGEKLTGPHVYRNPDGGLQLEFDQEFDVP
jgi:hypothetical protein